VELSRLNAHQLGVAARTHFLQGNKFAPLPEHLQGEVDLLISNPPYIRRDELPELAQEVRHDPVEALDGGADGLIFYRALAAGLAVWLRPGGHVALEIGCDQGRQVTEILAASGVRDLAVSQDLAGRDRVVTGRLTTKED
jgi:release factor glutamine methyltransferase